MGDHQSHAHLRHQSSPVGPAAQVSHHGHDRLGGRPGHNKSLRYPRHPQPSQHPARRSRRGFLREGRSWAPARTGSVRRTDEQAVCASSGALSDETQIAEKNHWSECERAVPVADSDALGRPHRSVLSLVTYAMEHDMRSSFRIWALVCQAIGDISVIFYAVTA